MRRGLAILVGLLGLALIAGSAYDMYDAGRSHDRAEAAAWTALADASPRPVDAAASTDRVPVAGTARHGEPLGTLAVPRLGGPWPLSEGTDDDTLVAGPGHYAGTPLPGARGNVGIAAHRAGNGSPFLDFDRLVPGDEVRVEQAGTVWTYEVGRLPWVVDADEMTVLRPLPGRWLTLTTCWPRYGSSRRMVTRAELVRVQGPGGDIEISEETSPSAG